MLEGERLEALRREIANERSQKAEKNRKSSHESNAETRIHLDRWRENVRRRFLDAWLDDTAYKLCRPRETVRLLDIPKTYALQDADVEAGYLVATGQLSRFYREAPIERRGEIERLLSKVEARFPIRLFISSGVSPASG
ncbi:MAG: hypothetical protein ACR2JW_12650 [Thermomicrobiales bacterium]